MTSTSHFAQTEGVKGGSLYFIKLNRCHSANTPERHGTQHCICISYWKRKKKKSLNLRVPLGPPPAAKECKDKDRVRVYSGRNTRLAYKAGNKATMSKQKRKSPSSPGRPSPVIPPACSVLHRAHMPGDPMRVRLPFCSRSHSSPARLALSCP